MILDVGLLFTLILLLLVYLVNVGDGYNLPISNIKQQHRILRPIKSSLKSKSPKIFDLCYFNGEWVDCSTVKSSKYILGKSTSDSSTAAYETKFRNVFQMGNNYNEPNLTRSRKLSKSSTPLRRRLSMGGKEQKLHRILKLNIDSVQGRLTEGINNNNNNSTGRRSFTVEHNKDEVITTPVKYIYTSTCSPTISDFANNAKAILQINITCNISDYKNITANEMTTSYPLENSIEIDLDRKMRYTTTKPTEITTHEEFTLAPISHTNMSPVPIDLEMYRYPHHDNASLFNHFRETLDQLERKFYVTTFKKLSANSPTKRQENGITFIQSGLFLHLILIALSTEVDSDVRDEIDKCVGLDAGDADKVEIIKEVLSWLPNSNDDFKFRWSNRLVLGASLNVSRRFAENIALALQLHLEQLNGTETPDVLTKTLNHMVEIDSGGAMHNTFAEDELTEGVSAVVLSTLYVRARWRSAPTLLNGSRAFHDFDDNSRRSTRVIRVNDIIGYADLNEWDAEALEISYATPDLKLLLLVPRGRSLRKLSGYVAETSINTIMKQMHMMRVAVTLPLYTLRMTLLLPSKLQSMGISKLLSIDTNSSDLRLSHAVQRIMFWSEAGTNAFKDDGIEWDESPELEFVVDRPYLFFLRWRNVTLINGNFVL